MLSGRCSCIYSTAGAETILNTRPNGLRFPPVLEALSTISSHISSAYRFETTLPFKVLGPVAGGLALGILDNRPIGLLHYHSAASPSHPLAALIQNFYP
jgi:hypothetical protein